MKYLNGSEIIAINAYLIKRYLPNQKISIKNAKALDFALEQPKKIILDKELYPTLDEKAAVLLSNLIRKKIFAHANKRTALVATIQFYQINGIKLSINYEKAGKLAERWNKILVN